MRHVALIFIALLGTAAYGATTPDAAVTACDRLAANPEDPDRLLPGLTRAQMDLPAAIAACEGEIARQPSQQRLRYQLARSLFYAGAAAEARDYYERLLVEDLIERFDSVGLQSRP